MIKRLIGLVAAAATVAVVIFAAMGYGSYRSMLFADDAPQGVRAADSAASAVDSSAGPSADFSADGPALAAPEHAAGEESPMREELPAAAGSAGSAVPTGAAAADSLAGGSDSLPAAASDVR